MDTRFISFPEPLNWLQRFREFSTYPPIHQSIIEEPANSNIHLSRCRYLRTSCPSKTPAFRFPRDVPSMPIAIILLPEMWQIRRNTSCSWHATFRLTVSANICFMVDIPLSHTADQIELSVQAHTQHTHHIFWT